MVMAKESLQTPPRVVLEMAILCKLSVHTELMEIIPY